VSGASQRLRANRDSFAAIPISDVQPAASIEGAMTVFAEQIEAVDAAVDRLGERSPVLRRQREREPACDRMTREE
jgi:ubiquinone biosynthesis protein UbiJ